MSRMELQPLETKSTQLEKSGATREASYKAIVGGLTATKMTVDKFGIEHIEDDHTSRLRAAEMIARLNGDLKTDTVIDNRQVTITIGKEDLVPLIDMVKDVNKQLLQLKDSGRQTGEIIDVNIG